MTLAILVVFSFLRGDFGAHWGAPLLVLGVFAFAETAAAPQLRPYLKRNVLFALLLLLPALLLLLVLRLNLAPVIALMSDKNQYRIQQMFDLSDGSLAQQLALEFPQTILASASYGGVSMLENSGSSAQPITAVLLFNVSKYGRNHDIFTDYLQLNGKDVVLLAKKLGDDGAEYAPYFTQLTPHLVATARGQYQVFLGQGFNAQAYRQALIQPLLDTYYSKIPRVYGSCYMDKYRPW
jgi:hypothetical protein